MFNITRSFPVCRIPYFGGLSMGVTINYGGLSMVSNNYGGKSMGCSKYGRIFMWRNNHGG